MSGVPFFSNGEVLPLLLLDSVELVSRAVAVTKMLKILLRLWRLLVVTAVSLTIRGTAGLDTEGFAGGISFDSSRGDDGYPGGISF